MYAFASLWRCSCLFWQLQRGLLDLIFWLKTQRAPFTGYECEISDIITYLREVKEKIIFSVEPFHNNLPKYSVFMHWFSLRNYEMGVFRKDGTISKFCYIYIRTKDYTYINDLERKHFWLENKYTFWKPAKSSLKKITMVQTLHIMKLKHIYIFICLFMLFCMYGNWKACPKIVELCNCNTSFWQTSESHLN